MLRRGSVAAAALALLLALLAPGIANAATSAAFSDEIGGSSAAARNTAQGLRTAWATNVAANGGTVQPTIILSTPGNLTGVIATAADGTTLSVLRTRYTLGSAPVYTGPSATPGTATCTANGALAGGGLQGGAPRPTPLVGGSASCPNGFAYGESGGAGESTSRDAVEFTFSRPVLAFGAWFGDLETRTDGLGVAALVRLYGPGDVLLSEQQVQPGPTYLPQSNCGGSYTGCGNNTTRWVGFVADPAQPVLRMVVIVGDDDAGGNAGDEGIGFIGPTFDLTTASLSLGKSVAPLADTNADGLAGAGDQLQYSFLVTNTGTAGTTALAVADANASGMSCPVTVLAAGASTTCTATHLVTQAETNTGFIDNTATATASAYAGTISSNASSAHADIPSVESLTITKVVDLTTYSAVGDVLSYDIDVANAGNVTLTNVTIEDLSPGTTSNCPAVNVTLQPGGATSCSASHIVTAADLDAGSVVNTASTMGTAPNGSVTGPHSDSVTSTAVQSAGLGLTKTVDEATFDAVGDELVYTITATNLGNVTIDDLAITDDAPGDGVFSSDCSEVEPVLSASGSVVCTATYSVTQADLDAGSVTNTADAAGTAPDGDTVTAGQATASSTASVLTGLGLTKVVDEATFGAVGDELHFHLELSNTGTVTLEDAAIVDPSPGDGDFATDCDVIATTLAPGAAATCDVTYTVTQADLDAGGVTNIANAGAATLNGTEVTAPQASVSSVALGVGALALVKSVDVSSYDVVGDLLTYTVTVSNEGNVTLAAVAVTDVAPGPGAFTSDCDTVPTTIAPGSGASCTVTYTVTQADLDAGSVTNIANASAELDGEPIEATPATATSTAEVTRGLSIEKTVDEASFDGVGDVLHFNVTVENVGTVTLHDLAITDPNPGSGAFSGDCDAVATELPPSATASCTMEYTVTQADLDAGSVTNTASAASVAPDDEPVGSGDATATAQADTVHSLTLVKLATEASYTAVGEVIHYSLELTNGGNVTIAAPVIDDPAPGSGTFSSTCDAVTGPIAPGDSVTCTAEYTITQADLDAGDLTNTADGSGIAPNGDAVSAPQAEATAAADQRTELVLTKTATQSDFNEVGDALDFTLVLSNAGNVTMTSATITDSAPGSGQFDTDCGDVLVTLAPGDTVGCSASYSVTQADLDAGGVTNNGLGTAIDPELNTQSSNTASATVVALQLPSLEIVKTVSEAWFHAVGDVLHFTITVENTGNVSFSQTTIDDPNPGDGVYASNCGTVDAPLAPGETLECTSSYTISASDVADRVLVNAASASAVVSGGQLTLGPIPASASVPWSERALPVTGGGLQLALLGAGAVLLGLGGLALLGTLRRRQRTLQ